jgi:hypothetical protein
MESWIGTALTEPKESYTRPEKLFVPGKTQAF